MNWITKALKFGAKIKKILKKRPTKEEIDNSDWTNCCTGPILKKDLEENLFVCNACGKHHRMSCIQRFDTFFGKNNYELIKTPLPSEEDPLSWNDTKSYKDRLKDAKKKTEQDCAIMVAKGNIKNIEVTVAASNFSFLGGSISLAESEALIYAIKHAIDNKTPFINFCSGGGMRMMASAISLTKGMAATTIAINELKKNKLPYIVCVVDPCAGGISASYAMTGDIIMGEVGALCAFAGRRVVQATVKEELPDDFQSVEFLQKHGFIDKVVHRKELGHEIGNLLSILLKKNTEVNLNSKNETSDNFEKITKTAS
ncbi:acetyl-CoA carboxylase carboxyl transferase subunit beta [Candidatus Pelagibacter sp.]|nr:acetyl-CoA carboxylase carboxyl transferase subunit beta [Candidatus Pelagibacter sp.]